jgi:fatty-acyl-CoA synthase
VPAIEQIPLESRGLPSSTYALLERAAEKWPYIPSVSFIPAAQAWNTPITLTFGGLRARVTQVANAMSRLGITRTDAVGILTPNTSEAFIALLASEAVGIASPINPTLASERILAMLMSTGARALVVAGPEFGPQIWAGAMGLAGLPQVEQLIVIRPDGIATAAPELPTVPGVTIAYLKDLADAEDAGSLVFEAPAPTDIAAYFHTGGTTGVPKIAAHTHGNQVSMAWMLAASESLNSPDPLFAGLPLFHVNALLVTGLAPLFIGRRSIWAPPLGYRDREILGRFWKIVEHYRISGMSAVPTVYGALAQVPVDADISTLRIPAVGAAPLPAAVRVGFAKHTGIELLEGYGLTEATCVSALSFPGVDRKGAIGQRLPYQQVKAVLSDAETGEWIDLPVGEPGLLVVSGPTVFAGYLRDGVVTRGELVRDGWLDTGDIGRVDHEGFVYLQGRLKDLIIRGGHNIDPAIVEEAVLSHPDVIAAAAVGRPDLHSGEVPVVYVVLRQGHAASTDDIREWAHQHVSEPAAAPKDVIEIGELPLTEVGKVYKVALQQDAARRLVAQHLSDIEGEAEITSGERAPSIAIAAAPDVRDKVTAALDGYTFAWHFETAS